MALTYDGGNRSACPRAQSSLRRQPSAECRVLCTVALACGSLHEPWGRIQRTITVGANMRILTVVALGVAGLVRRACLCAAGDGGLFVGADARPGREGRGRSHQGRRLGGLALPDRQGRHRAVLRRLRHGVRQQGSLAALSRRGLHCLVHAEGCAPRATAFSPCSTLQPSAITGTRKAM